MLLPAYLRLDGATAEGSSKSPSSRPRHSTRPPSPDLSPSECKYVATVKAYQINLDGPSLSNLSHNLRSAQSMEVGRLTTAIRVLGGPILLDPTRGSQRRKLTHSADLNWSKVKSKNKSKSKSNFLWPCLVTRLLHKCKSSPRTDIRKSMAVWSKHTPKLSVKWLQRFKVPLGPDQPKSTLSVNSQAIFGTFPSSFPSSHSPRFDSSRIATTLFTLTAPPTSIAPICCKEMPSAVLCVYSNQET